MILGFVFALITVRCLMAVVNRGFFLVDYAKQQLMGKDGKKTGLKDMVIQTFGPPLMQGFAQMLGVGELPKAK